MTSGQPDYMHVTLLKGQDNTGNLVTIAVDEDGNLISVMKGDFEGALQNIAVDDQGRILAVLTDPEDVFGNPHYMGAAELAVRQGSIVNFDRLGNVVWLDDFESTGKKWVNQTTMQGSAKLSNNYAKNGNNSMRVKVDSGDGSKAGVKKYIPTPVSSKLGYEISFSMEEGVERIVFFMDLYTGSVQYYARVSYHRNTGKLQYYDFSTPWVDFSDVIKITRKHHLFSTIKFVMDITTKNYVRCRLNENTIDMSAINIYNNASAGWPKIDMGFWVETANGTSPVVYFDDFILTQNEP